MTPLDVGFATIDYALHYLRDKTGRQKALRHDFAEAFREALIQTRSYIADRRDEVSERDRKRELELARAWSKVGLLGLDLDPQGDFYEVFFRKSDFWSDPRGWDLSDKGQLDISLERAEAEASRYLSAS